MSPVPRFCFAPIAIARPAMASLLLSAKAEASKGPLDRVESAQFVVKEERPEG